MIKGIARLCTCIAVGLVALSGCGESGPTGPGMGALAIDVVTSGSRLDLDGYIIVVESGSQSDSSRVSTVERVVIENLAPGEYSIELTDLASNCYAQGDARVSAVVLEDDVATADFRLRCFTPIENEIVFSSDRNGSEDLYAIRPDGTGERRLTFTDSRESRPAVSPDGTEIAYIARTGPAFDDPFDLFVIRADGTGRRNLTQNDAAEGKPSWSPDGGRIAFASDPPRFGPSSIFVMDADGTNLESLTVGGDGDSDAAWSPVGTLIAFSRGVGAGQVYTIRPDGSGITQITNGSGLRFGAAWSPTGAEIAYMGQPDDFFDIYVVAAGGGASMRLTNRPGVDYRPDWSPDGASLVYVSNETGFDHLHIIGRDGSGPRQLTFGAWNDGPPDWAD